MAPAQLFPAKLPFGVVHLLEDGLGAAPDGRRAHGHGTDRKPKHGGRFGGGGQRVSSLGQGPVHVRKGGRDVQSFAGRTPLRLHADRPDPLQEGGEFIGNLHQLGVQLVVLHALKHLVEAVQSPVETVVGTAPQPLSQFRVILAPLPGSAEKAQAEP